VLLGRRRERRDLGRFLGRDGSSHV
jgi:hypothetical protein